MLMELHSYPGTDTLYTRGLTLHSFAWDRAVAPRLIIFSNGSHPFPRETEALALGHTRAG